MKYVLSLVLAFLLLMILGCSDESLVGVEAGEEPLATETAPVTDKWITPPDVEDFHWANTEDDMVLFMGEFDVAGDAEASSIPCVDADGNPVPDLMVFARVTATGKVFYLDETTGDFISDQCIADADGTLTVTGAFSLTGSGGDGFGGTYTLVQAPLIPPATTASLEHTEVVTHGTGRFAGASGWSRGIGAFDSATGTGKVYLKGLISMPKDVEKVQFQGEFTAVPDTTGAFVQCVDAGGDPVPDLFVPGKFLLGGVAMHLGVIDEDASSVAVEGCTFFPDEGRLSGPLTGIFTGANGDALFAAGTGDIFLDGTYSVKWTINDGAGRLDGATGWFDAVGTEGPEGDVLLTTEGWIYQLR